LRDEGAGKTTVVVEEDDDVVGEDACGVGTEF
jgi:hypothetical protein